MYRQYEDPNELEKRLRDLEAAAQENPDDIDLTCEVNEMRERVNFAWQDDEFDDFDDEYTPSAYAGDYGPSNPWNAPGMSVSDFI